MLQLLPFICVRLGASKLGAVEHSPAILEEDLDELELVVAQEEHQFIFTVPIVRGILHVCVKWKRGSKPKGKDHKYHTITPVYILISDYNQGMQIHVAKSKALPSVSLKLHPPSFVMPAVQVNTMHFFFNNAQQSVESNREDNCYGLKAKTVNIILWNDLKLLNREKELTMGSLKNLFSSL